MATLDIVIEAKNKTGKAFNEVSGSLGELDRKAKNMGDAFEPFNNASKRVFSAVATTAAVAGTAVVGTMGTMAVDGLAKFSDLQAGMNEVFTLLPDMTAIAMSEMQGQVQEFNTEFGLLSSESVPALYQAISAGVPKENVFEFLEKAQMAAMGGVTELETAVDGITSVVNAYGRDVMTATKASDLMFTAVKLGKTNFDELSRSLFNVIPTAASIGVGFDVITAALAAMTAQGTPTSVATTQIRQLLVELNKEGGATGKLFAELAGKSFKDFISAGGNVQDALKLLEKYADENNTTISTLFGSVEAGNAALALTGKGTVTFTDNLVDMQDSAGATDKAFAQMDKGISRSIDRIRAVWATLMEKVGERLAPVFEEAAGWVAENIPKMEETLVGAFSEIAEWALKKLPDALEWLTTAFGWVQNELIPMGKKTIPEVIAQMGELWGVISPLVERVGEIVDAFFNLDKEHQKIILGLGVFVLTVGPVVTAIAGLFGALGTIFTAASSVVGVITGAGGVVLSLGALLTPIGLAVAAVAGLALAWGTDFLGIKTTTQRVAKDIAENWGPFTENLAKKTKQFVEDAVGYVENLATDFSKKFVEIRDYNIKRFESLRDGIKDSAREFADSAVKKVKDMAGDVGEKFSEIRDDAVGKFVELRNGAIGKLGTLLTDAKTVATNIGGGVKTKLANGLENAEKVFETLKSDAKNILNNMKTAVAGIARAAGKAISTSLKTGLVEKAQAFITSVSDFASDIKSKFDAMILKFITSGENIVSGIIQGVINKSRSAIDSIRNFGSNLLGAFNDALRMFSPSKAFAESGENIILGLTQGISESGYRAFGALSTVADGLIGEADRISNTVGSTLEGIVGGGDSVVDTVVGGIIDPEDKRTQAEIREAMFAKIKDALVDFADETKAVLNGLMEPLRATSMVRTQASGFTESVRSMLNDIIDNGGEELYYIKQNATRSLSSVKTLGEILTHALSSGDITAAANAFRRLGGIAQEFEKFSNVETAERESLSSLFSYGNQQLFSTLRSTGILDNQNSLNSITQNTALSDIQTALQSFVNFRDFANQRNTGTFDSATPTDERLTNNFYVQLMNSAANGDGVLSDIQLLQALYGSTP